MGGGGGGGVGGEDGRVVQRHIEIVFIVQAPAWERFLDWGC